GARGGPPEGRMSKKGIYAVPGDLDRPSSGADRLDEQRYNVRLEFARGTERAMTRKAGELGLKGPKGLLVYALIKIGVDVDEADRRVLRRMDEEHAPPPRDAPARRNGKRAHADR